MEGKIIFPATLPLICGQILMSIISAVASQDIGAFNKRTDEGVSLYALVIVFSAPVAIG